MPDAEQLPYVENRWVPKSTAVAVGKNDPGEGWVRIPTGGAEAAERRISKLEDELRSLRVRWSYVDLRKLQALALELPESVFEDAVRPILRGASYA